MDIIAAIGERRAYRAISAEPLPEDSIRRIVEAGSLAPSCYNNQPWRVVAASGESLGRLREALAEGNAWATAAPLIVALAVRASDDCRLDDGRDYALFDAGLFAMNLMTQACAEGLTAHPIAGYNPKKAKAALGIPADYVLAVLIIVGKPGAADDSMLKDWQKQAEHAPRQRKPLGELVYRDSWGNPLA